LNGQSRLNGFTPLLVYHLEAMAEVEQEEEEPYLPNEIMEIFLFSF